jgi:hypothetical protein
MRTARTKVARASFEFEGKLSGTAMFATDLCPNQVCPHLVCLI